MRTSKVSRLFPAGLSVNVSLALIINNNLDLVGKGGGGNNHNNAGGNNNNTSSPLCEPRDAVGETLETSFDDQDGHFSCLYIDVGRYDYSLLCQWEFKPVSKRKCDRWPNSNVVSEFNSRPLTRCLVTANSFRPQESNTSTLAPHAGPSNTRITPGALIAGIAIGLVFSIIAVASVLLLRRRRRRREVGRGQTTAAPRLGSVSPFPLINSATIITARERLEELFAATQQTMADLAGEMSLERKVGLVHGTPTGSTVRAPDTGRDVGVEAQLQAVREQSDMLLTLMSTLGADSDSIRGNREPPPESRAWWARAPWSYIARRAPVAAAGGMQQWAAGTCDEGGNERHTMTQCNADGEQRAASACSDASGGVKPGYFLRRNALEVSTGDINAIQRLAERLGGQTQRAAKERSVSSRSLIYTAAGDWAAERRTCKAGARHDGGVVLKEQRDLNELDGSTAVDPSKSVRCF
ncbi:hypothetical protein GGX14DRAFT_674444 [Mycena pura]|uniref:Uncharacterized protein n=1 Tax=Mycena pura TaxID=153505 RepID=A0AAD6UZA2_9AGAR|nr:hypothetical protein GGX14DRAFT_674444 [Mycena pura]